MRLASAYALTFALILAGLGVLLDRSLEAEFSDDLTRSLRADAKTVQSITVGSGRVQQAEVQKLARSLEIRITLIDSKGAVIADSERDPQTMENHSSRPEVKAALAGSEGISNRSSSSVGKSFRYLALPPAGGIVVRVALASDVIDSHLASIRKLIFAGVVVAVVASTLLVPFIARRFSRPLQRMTEATVDIASGDLTRRVPVDSTLELMRLGESVNRMADELHGRLITATEDRRTRDTILAAMAEGVALMDGAGSVQYLNPAAESMLGLQNRDGQQLASHSFVRLANRSREAGRAEEVIETGVPRRVIRVSAIPIEGGGRVLIVLRDITETSRVEAVRKDFAAAASHELKTPVASLRAAAETLASLVDDPEAAKHFAEQLLKDAERLSQLISDLLDLSRLESEQPSLQRISLASAANEEAGRLAPVASKAGVALEVEAEDVLVEGSMRDLSLAIRNLLENAIQYTRPSGKVMVLVSKQDGEAVVSVGDSGIGIPSKDLPRIFERFYRVDRARSRNTGGTGLGLSLVKHVAEQHGGRVEVDSELGRGSIFRLILPLAV